MTVALNKAIRTALIDAPGIGDELDQWKNEPAVFTRRPIPDDAPSRCILINPPSAQGDEDGLDSPRPWFVKDIVVYGPLPDDFRKVEEIADLIYLLFHRKRFSVQPEGYSVIDIVATGPTPAPVDDESTVGRLVSLTIRLRRNS